MSKEQFPILTKRHSLSHMLAAAVLEVCPEAKLGIGPAIEEGFYYDFLLPDSFKLSPEVIEDIEKRAKGLTRQDFPFTVEEKQFEEARRMFAAQPFKLELIRDLEAAGNPSVLTYRSGPFTDLCRGPHVENVRSLRDVAWKIDRVSGAYWKGDSTRPMLQRIYALAFASPNELADFEHRREEAAKRDHRKLGTDLELFTFSDLVGKGLPLMLPKGATLFRTIERFVVDEELRRGYLHVKTPHLAKRQMYEVSGHWQLYKDGMYPPMDVGGEELMLRPMACPHHFMIYKDKPRSYRELPMRIAEVASQFRREQSGELTGLVRVMYFNLADAHIVCRPDQLEAEFKSVLELIVFCAKCFGIESVMSYRASLRDDVKAKYVDNPQMWEMGESILLKIIKELNLPYEEGKGHAAFYGPKLDVQMKNVLGKEETIFTVQIDFCMPDRFDMTYIDSTGAKQRPVIIHRSSVGCLERIIAFMIEYYGGAFPLWLSPVQVSALTVTDAQDNYARTVLTMLRERGLRCEADFRNETIGKKIREARLQRIPYLLVLGPKEVQNNTVTIRNRDTGEQSVLSPAELAEKLSAEVKSYAPKLGI